MKKTRSIWGNPPKRLYKLIDLAEKSFGKNYSACVVGCSDGRFLLPFARKGIKVTGYEIDDVALYGGEKEFPVITDKILCPYSKNFVSKEYRVENKHVRGIIKRVEEEGLSEYVNVERRDFYKNVPKEQFDVVFTSCSLHYSINLQFTSKDKIISLQNIVSESGYLYIDYMMAIDEADTDRYPVNKYFRKGEMRNYFDESWKIISLIEKDRPSFERAHVERPIDHFHRFGYLLAQKTS